MILFTCDQKLTKSRFSPDVTNKKKIMEKLKQKTVEQYRVREESPVGGVQWAVRSVVEDLWREVVVGKCVF